MSLPTNTRVFIICQFIILFVTCVFSCPAKSHDDEEDPPFYPTGGRDPGGREATSEDPTEPTNPASERVQGEYKIVEFEVQPEQPNNTEHAWVMICKEGSEPFDQCCISNQLWYFERLPRQKRTYRHISQILRNLLNTMYEKNFTM